MPDGSRKTKPQPLRKDIFTIPFMDGYILYVPHTGLVAGVDKSVHGLVSEIRAGKGLEAGEFSNKWLDAFDTMGLFEAPGRLEKLTIKDFQPTEATLSLSSRCTLRCVYCYARAGEEARDMDPAMALATIDFIVDNAVRTGKPDIRINFHGEGEPTANWKLFSESVTYAENLAKSKGLEVFFSMSSNAMWGRRQRQFIVRHFKDMSISLDGISMVQNRQRPTPNGKDSFSVVLSNIQFLQEKGVDYGLRATVLPDSVPHMKEFVDYVADNLNCEVIGFEPYSQTGRGSELDCEYEQFFEAFKDTMEDVIRYGESRGIFVNYSACRPEMLSENFCHSAGPEPNFVVTTVGDVSSCYEIVDPQTSKGCFTVYGRYDADAGRFVFDKEALERLLNFDVRQLPHCTDCFARWNCSGDCMARAETDFDALEGWSGNGDSPRCRVNREMTLQELIRKADFSVTTESGAQAGELQR